MSSGALTLELRLAPCSEQRLSRVGFHHGRAWGDDLGHVPRRPIDAPAVYAALGDSISIDEYAGGSGLGGASLFARNRDDTFPWWRGRDLTTVHPPHTPRVGLT
jgi:hypothetical protein